MAIFKCKMCGGQLEITEGASICTCEYCGTEQTLPRLDTDKKMNLYDRANHFRRNNDYDKAMGIYEQILNEDSTDAEAYWSLVLCRYGIEYVEDPATHKRIPTINRAQYTSIYADENYKSAIANADALQKNVYEQEAKTIDSIQKGILAISEKEEPFDVFICYKESDANGRRTPDSVLANDLYHQLIQEGFKVFFARITLEDKLGQEYEPYIFAALNSAKVMVVLGTKPEYFTATWVRNEWSRFLGLIRGGAQKMLIPAYKDMDPYDLPEEFSHLQAQDMSKLGFMQDLIRGIKKIIGAEQEKAVHQETTAAQQIAPNNNLVMILKRGNMALEDGEWDKADGFFEEALYQDAECAEAFLGKWMAKMKVGSLEKLKAHYIQKYEQGKTEKLTACEADSAHIEEMAGKHSIDRYLDRKQIQNLYEADRSYTSMLSCRKKQKEEELQEIRTEKLYMRTIQYAQSSTKAAVDGMMQEITAVLDQRIDEAGRRDEESIARIKASYRTMIETADKKTEEMYRSAYERKEADYQSLVEEFNRAVQIPDFEAVKSKLQSFGDYSDAKEYVQKCEEKITEIQAILQRKAARVAKKKKIITVSCVTAVLVLIALYKFVIGPAIVQHNLKVAKVGDSVKLANIEWLVLETQGNQKLLITKNAIEKRAYHSTLESVTWEKCDLRTYLNGTWLTSTFTETERKMIVETSVKNADNSKYGTEGGKDTNDKVFLLSIDEVNKYFSSESARSISVWWWLRSPGYYGEPVAYVNSDGSVHGSGRSVDRANGAVRPALWIDVSNL